MRGVDGNTPSAPTGSNPRDARGAGWGGIERNMGRELSRRRPCQEGGVVNSWRRTVTLARVHHNGCAGVSVHRGGNPEPDRRLVASQ